MKHYHTIKHTVLNIILASILLLVVNISVWTANYLFISDISPTKANDVCAGRPRPATTTILSPAPGTFTISFTRATSNAFDYHVIVKEYDQLSGDGQTLMEFTDHVNASATELHVPARTYTGAGTASYVHVIITFAEQVSHDNTVSNCSFGHPIEERLFVGHTTQTIGRVTNLSTSNDLLSFQNGTPSVEIFASFDTSAAGQQYTLTIKDSNNFILFWEDRSVPTTVSPQDSITWQPPDKNDTYTITATLGTDTASKTITVVDSATSVPGQNSTNLSPQDNKIDGLNDFVGNFTFPKKIETFGQIFELVIKLLFEIIGVLAFISLMVGGIQFVTSGGDSAKASKAKKTMLFSVLGIIIAIFSVSIYQIATKFLSGPKLQ